MKHWFQRLFNKNLGGITEKRDPRKSARLTVPCHRCNNADFQSISDIDIRVGEDEVLPTLITACKQCGLLAMHAKRILFAEGQCLH